MLTFTPLQGITPLIKHLREVGTWEIGVTWDDVPHLTAEDKAAILKDTPAYLRDARSKGVPLLGSGVVFTVAEDESNSAHCPARFRTGGAASTGWTSAGITRPRRSSSPTTPTPT
jgi:hypothetical protein